MQKWVCFFCVFMSSVFAEPILIGIAGGTGSGKTTLADKIHQALPKSVLIYQDSYYYDLSHLSLEERGQTNFDHPDSIDFGLLKQHLIELKNSRSIDSPVYMFSSHTRDPVRTRFIEPAPVIIVEGILLFSVPEIRELFDVKVYIDTEDDIRLMRRLERDIKERGRTFESVKNQYLGIVKPMHDLFVEPSKKYADICVPGRGDNQIAIDLILAKLLSRYSNK